MKQFLYTILACTLFACSTTKVETEYKDIEALRASAIYRGDSVLNYIEKYHDRNKEIAASYLEQAEDIASNNILKAVYFTKRAITLHPTLDNYLLLAKQLEKAESYKELARLYDFITKEQYLNKLQKSLYVFEKPNETVFYESIVTSIIAYNYLDMETSYMVTELGFSASEIKERLQNEPRIKLDKQGKQFKFLMLQFLPYEEVSQYAKKPEVFKDFIASLNDTTDVFEIDQQAIQQFNYEDFNGINYDGEGAITFSYIYTNYLAEKQDNPDKWFQYNFIRSFKLNDSITVIEYAIDSSATACPKDMRHIYHRIATYNNNSVKLIDSKIVALQSGEQLATASFRKNIFTIIESKRVWKKPYDKHEFDNDFLSIERTGTSVFSIAEDGFIKETLN